LQCVTCGTRRVTPASVKMEKCACGGAFESLLVPIVDNGKLAYEMPAPQEIRRRVLQQLEKVEL